MVFDWLRGKKRPKSKEEERASQHPFDRASREILDDLEALRMSSEELEEREAKREAMEQLKRLKV